MDGKAQTRPRSWLTHLDSQFGDGLDSLPPRAPPHCAAFTPPPTPLSFAAFAGITRRDIPVFDDLSLLSKRNTSIPASSWSPGVDVWKQCKTARSPSATLRLNSTLLPRYWTAIRSSTQ
jgi:hypothetical protein